MANNADGSIVIDTELDNDGFEHGAKKLEGHITSLLNKVNGIGDTLERSFSTFTPLLQSIAANTQQIYARMASGSSQAAAGNEQMRATQQGVEQSIRQTSQAMQQEGQAINTFTGNANTAAQTISSLEREVNSLSAGMSSISESAQRGFSNANAVLSFDAKLMAMGEKIEAAKQKLAEFGAQKLPTEDYAWLQQAIEKTEAELNKLIDKQIQMDDLGVRHNSAQWQKVTHSIEQARLMLETYRGEMADLEATGGAFTLGSDSQQYAQMQAALQNAEASLQRNRSLIDSEAIAQARLNVLTAQETVYAAQTESARAAALERLREAQAELQAAAAQSSQGGASPETTASWENFGQVLQRAGQQAVRLTATLGRMSFWAINSGAKKAVSSLKSFARQSAKTTVTTKGLVRALTSLKRLLITRVKRMFISSIFNTLKESMHSLALFSDAFNQSMSNIKNRSKEMGANVAVSMANLINAIAPAMAAVISAISKAITYLNAFFALLRGKSTVTVAKKQTGSYADSLKDAADAAKELNRQVYGFDELNKRSKESTSSGGAADGSDLFEEVPIADLLPDSVRDFFERLKAAIEAGDWYGVGQIIAEGLNSGMKIVDDWINTVFRPLGVKWAKNIAQILNGLVDGFDWELLGKTVADGINAIADIINTFLTTFNFENLGKGIGRAINSLFDNVDWKLLGETIANYIMAGFNFAYGIISTTDFLKIGKDLAEMINTAIATADFKRIGETLGGALRGAIQLAFGFVESIDFDTLSAKITAAAEAFLAKMNAVDPRTGLNGWQELGTALADAANGIVQAFESIPWGEVAKGVGETISTFLSKSNIEVKLLLGALLINGISKILFGKGILSVIASQLGKSLLSSLSETWPTLGSSIKGAFSSLGTALSTFATTDVLAASAGQIGAAILAGLFIGGEIGKLIDNHIIGPLIEALGGDQVTAELYKNFHWFGEGGFFDEMWTDNASFLENVQIWGEALGMMFSDAWEGIKSGASTAWGGISSFLSSAWEGIKSGASTAWEGIKSSVSTAWAGVQSGVSSVTATVSSTLSSAWNGIKSTASSAWSGISGAVTSAFTGAKNTVVSTAGTIKSNLSTTWNGIKSGASTAWSNIKTSVTTAFNNTKSTVVSAATTMKSSLSSSWNTIRSNATQAWNGIKSTAVSAWNNMKSSASSSVSNIKSTCSSAWGSIQSTASSKWSSITSTVSSKWSNLKSILRSTDWTSIGSNLVSGLKSGITSAWSSLTTSVGNLCKGLLEKVKGAFGIASPSKKMAEIGGFLDAGLENGITDNQKSVHSTVSNLANAVADEMAGADVPELAVAGTSMVSGLDAVADKLSGIAQIFQGITDMLAKVGFSAPQIAMGTVIPAKTRIDATGNGGMDTISAEDWVAIKEYLSGVDEQLVDLRRGQAELIRILGKLNLNIDIDALTRAITKQQRDRQLNFGGA